MDPANHAHFSFSCPVSGLEVLAFEGHEALSRLFEFRLHLVQEAPYGAADAIDPRTLIGQPATLTLRRQLQLRNIHGILEEFRLLSSSTDQVEYEAKLVPSVAALQHNQDCRIFQQKTTPEILEAVLNARGFAGRFSFLLMQSYLPRDYCVQYNESDWNFLCRLMEEDGIFFAFEHRGLDTLVISDGLHAYDSCGSLEYRPEASVQPVFHECLTRVELGSERRPTSVTLRDYRFKSPQVKMESHLQGDPSTLGGELYHYPGEFVESEVGRHLSLPRLEEAQKGGLHLRAEGNVLRAQPGSVFQLQSYPAYMFNQGWLITQVQHRGEQAQSLKAAHVGGFRDRLDHLVRLRGMPARECYRPSRTTKRPYIGGLQSAVVVGPPGETIHTDAYGRVKVKFHWDRAPGRDESASCWIRVNQPWAGAGYGALFLPRIGQEVMIQFLEGDPDRPVVLGRIHNDQQRVPYPLPARQTLSTLKSQTVGGQGYNELRFEDQAGREEVYLHGQKDWNIHIRRVKDERIGTDKRLDVGANRTDWIGRNRTEQIGEHERLQVGMNRTQQIGLTEQRQVKQHRKQHIGQDDILKVGYNLLHDVKKARHLRVGGHKELKVGKTMLTKTLEKCLHLTALKDQVEVQAKTFIHFEVGESQLVMQESGELLLVGKQLFILGEQTLDLRAPQILLNSDPPAQAEVQYQAGAASTEEPAPEQMRGLEGDPKNAQPYPKGSPQAVSQNLIAQSPSAQANLDAYLAQGGKIQYGAGSYFQDMPAGQQDIIQVSSYWANDPGGTAAVLSHELGHWAYSSQKPAAPSCAGMSQEQWADAMARRDLLDEGHAESAAALANIESKGAIPMKSTKGQEYVKIQKDPNKSQEAKCAEIGDLWGKSQKWTGSGGGNYYDGYYRQWLSLAPKYC